MDKIELYVKKIVTDNNKAFYVLFIIFCFMMILNTLKPLSSDDYFLAFVWPDGKGINAPLPFDAKRIADFSDLYKSIITYYYNWGGRITGQSLMTFFVWQGKNVFNIINAFMTIILIVEIYWLSHEGKVVFNFNPNYIIWIFFSLWTFNISFNDTFLWLSGSCEYLWTLVFLLAFLMPYVNDYFNKHSLREHNIILSFYLFFLGILAGDSRETVICWVIIILSAWLFNCYKKGNLHIWKIFGLIGLCIGYGLLIVAPGNYSRLALQQHTDRIVLTTELLMPKLMETFFIFTFHLFLWHFLLKFFIHAKRDSRFNDNKIIAPYIRFSKVCTIVAFCSGFLMTIIPSEGFRPSFVNLAFLTIAVSSLFRGSEKSGISIVSKTIIKHLKMLGYLYLILTISFALWGNYLNWCQWNAVLVAVKNAKQNHSNSILEIEPYVTRGKSFVRLLSGFHVSVMPINGVSEDDPINRSFARYYGIRGIRVVPKSLSE